MPPLVGTLMTNPWRDSHRIVPKGRATRQTHFPYTRSSDSTAPVSRPMLLGHQWANARFPLMVEVFQFEQKRFFQVVFLRPSPQIPSLHLVLHHCSPRSGCVLFSLEGKQAHTHTRSTTLRVNSTQSTPSQRRTTQACLINMRSKCLVSFNWLKSPYESKRTVTKLLTA